MLSKSLKTTEYDVTKLWNWLDIGTKTTWFDLPVLQSKFNIPRITFRYLALLSLINASSLSGHTKVEDAGVLF